MIKIFLKYNNRYINVNQVTNIELVRDSLHKAFELYEVRITTACNTKLVLHRAPLLEAQDYVAKLLSTINENCFDVNELVKKEEVVVQEMQQPVKKKRTVKKVDK